jgi:hypothetical protein
VAAYDEPVDLVGDQLTRGVDGRGLEQPDQFGKGFLATVVRGGGGEDQRVGVRCQRPGQPVVLGFGVGDVVRLVDHHRVPAVLASLANRPCLSVSMEMITRLK